MNVGDLQPELQSNSKYQKLFEGLQPHNYYRIEFDEQKSQQTYPEFSNIEPPASDRLDRLMNRIDEHILKVNYHTDWFRATVNEIKKTNDELKKSNSKLEKIALELKKSNEKQNKLNEEIFNWMKYIKKKTSGSHS